MASPASGVDFDRNRLSTGELIAGIAGIVLLIDLWFDWYGVKVTAGNGLLKGFSVGASADAWEAFSFIDIVLFVVALIAIAAAVARAMNNMPELPYPAATIVMIAGGVALVLILFRTISTPVDTHGISGIDVSRKIGLWIGLLSAAAITYGGWRAQQETDGGVSYGGGGGAAPAGPPAGTAPTTPMAPTGQPTTPAPAEPAAAPPSEPAAAAPVADPVPGETAGQTPPGLAGDPPPAGEETKPPGV